MSPGAFLDLVGVKDRLLVKMGKKKPLWKRHLLRAGDPLMHQAVGNRLKHPPSLARGSSKGLPQGLCVQTHITPLPANVHHPPRSRLVGWGQFVPFWGAGSIFSVTATFLQKALPVCILRRREKKWVITEQRGKV